MPFLYYVRAESGHASPRSLIETHGLRYAIDKHVHQPVRRGPDGHAGIVLANADLHDTPPKFLPQSQTWRPKVGQPEVWIGYTNPDPPRMDHLARRQQLAGRVIGLCDGSSVVVPIARRFVSHEESFLWSVALPQSLGRNEYGDWVPQEVVRQYRRLWDLLCEYLDAKEAAIRTASVEEGDAIWFQFPPINEMVIAAFTANYFVGPDEIEICGVYDQRVQREVIDVLCDESTRDAWLKKKLQDLTASGGISSLGLDPGTRDVTQDTAPQSPSITATE